MTGLLLGGLRLAVLGPVTLAALLLAVAGTWTRPGEPGLRPHPSEAPVEIWIVDNGFHTDLALPRDALDDGDGPLAEAVRSLPAGDWVLTGWGDATFYVDTSPIHERIPDGARAFLRPGNPSVVMLDPSDADPATAYAPGVAHRVRLSPEGFAALRARLEASLEQSGGRAVEGPPAERGDARFFRSVETFSVMHLCNHWAGELLHAGGLPVRPVRSILSSEIVRTARLWDEASPRTGSVRGQ